MNAAIAAEHSQYEQAVQAGERHRALLHRVRCHFLAVQAQTAEPAFPRPLVIAQRQPATSAADAVAFLACFTNATTDYVYPLKAGVNRVARDPAFGDFAVLPANVKVLEQRQWLVICQGHRAQAADDHSTNQSIVLSAQADLPAPAADPRRAGAAYSYTSLHPLRWPGRIDLDWAGNTLGELHDGTVVLTMYGAWVFGWLPRGPQS